MTDGQKEEHLPPLLPPRLSTIVSNSFEGVARKGHRQVRGRAASQRQIVLRNQQREHRKLGSTEVKGIAFLIIPSLIKSEGD